MESQEQREQLQNLFQDMIDKAKQIYPDIEDAISTYQNITENEINLIDYQLLIETEYFPSNNNHVSFY